MRARPARPAPPSSPMPTPASRHGRSALTRGGRRAGTARTRAALPAVVVAPQSPPPERVTTAISSRPALASTSAPPLQAAVSAATSLIGGVVGADATGLTLPGDGAGVVDAASLADTIRRDFQRAYFVSGDIAGHAYAPDTDFVDPTIAVKGLGAWRANIAALQPWLLSPTIELEGGGVEQVEDGSGAWPVTLRAAWRLRTAVALPWRPVVDVRGETLYECEAVGPGGGLRVRVHTEAWRTPAWAAVGQLLVPGGWGGSR